MATWEAIEPYQTGAGWLGRAQATDGHTTEAITCDHVHSDKADARHCGDELARAQCPPWCETCGTEVSPDGMCNCWCLLADALQQYLGLDHDGSAQMAADLWRAEADRERVRSAEYAADHFYGQDQQAGQPVRTYPDTRHLAQTEVRAQDARDYPHDEDCPKCGRRQWGLGAGTVDSDNPTDTEQETCGACGYVCSE